MSTKQNIHFENQASPILKIRRRNITLLQKLKSVKSSKTNFFRFFNSTIQYYDDCKTLHRNNEVFPQYNVLTKLFINIYVSK